MFPKINEIAGREEMYPLKFSREESRNVNAGPTEKMNLLIKLAKACSTFVVDKCF